MGVQRIHHSTEPSTLIPPLSSDESSHRTPSNVLPLSDQLRMARSIQRALLPQALPALQEWSIAGCCLSAGPIGGDFYDVFPLPSGGTMLLVADVMGKGIPAALIASVARTVIRMAVSSACGPADAFAHVNEMLYEDLSSADMFVTAQAAWLDTESGTLKLSCAGHGPVLLKDTKEKIHSFCPGGVPIGVAPRASYTETEIPLDSLGSALMFTDGVTDLRNPAGESFGQTRLQDWLKAAHHGPAEVLKEDLLVRLEAFQGQAELFDDQTLLLLTRNCA